LDQKLLEEARGLLDETVELRRRLHRQPEIGLDLPATQSAILDALEPLGLQMTTGDSTTSVVATIEGDKPGPTVLLRADMDALPLDEDSGIDYPSEVDGTMHACGHDAHSAMLVTAAKMLAARKAEIAGKVLLMFQPGEEGFFGAKYMIDEGLLDAKPAAAFAIHVRGTDAVGKLTSRPGPIMASADRVLIELRGMGGHASTPHMARDPVPAAAQIITASHALITRNIDPFDPAVLTITQMEAGRAYNVIPERVRLAGTLRTFSATTRSRVIEELDLIVRQVAAAHGLEGSAELTDGYPTTVNDESSVDFIEETCEEVLGGGVFTRMKSPSMGAEDFSYVLEQVPGAMVFLGCMPEKLPDGGPPAMNHSNRFVVDEDCLPVGVALHVGAALGYLEKNSKN
jgi:hippurate hydrolase